MSILGRGLAQRLGRLDPEVARLGGRWPIWLHAASVGEVLSAEPLVERLRRDEPEHPLFATTTSVTGRDTARARLGLPATLLPFDLPPLTEAALRRLEPVVLVILETEIWPSLIHAAAHHGVPVLMVSARISDRSAARYARVRPLFAGALARVSAIAAQTQADADRFIELGAVADRVRVSGSLKLARLPTSTACPPAVALGSRPVVVAASTQPGEEEAVLDACRSLWADTPELLLLLAPRRPERFDEVAALLQRRGLRFRRRSAGGEEIEPSQQVFLLDSVGELASFFPGAVAAFVGGTLAPLGGHNILEPAVFGVPVAFGPNLDNVRDAAALMLEAGGGTQVENAAELADAWRAALRDPAEGQARAGRVRSEMQRRTLVADDVAQLVRDHLRRRG